ncbi:hypothetical protein BDV28DRAFT_95985 [Aspergillus coremiiformis]|uniref:Uncharacterized protein n=1 Tax=Aspergillus coremiiformis TaxID=138285 RepID=A0A5N6Z8Q5_9EURO|nr:hypothetical protein BDV28DRAFT_95985 [Aspergillus coremiiformis]
MLVFLSRGFPLLLILVLVGPVPHIGGILSVLSPILTDCSIYCPHFPRGYCLEIRKLKLVWWHLRL